MTAKRINLNKNERLDDLQNGAFVIQRTDAFCFGIDAVLLAHFPEIRNRDKVLDMGCGCGVIPVIMSTVNKEAEFTGIEIQKDQADTAKRNVELNGLDERVRIIEGDIKDAVSIFGNASFSLITCNPPYMKKGEGKVSPVEAVAVAKHEVKITLSEIISTAAKLLKEKGRFALIHRPSRLPEIMALLKENRLEPKRLRMIHPYADKEASMVMIESVLGGGSFMKAEPPLTVYDGNGEYTEEILKIYGMQEKEK